MCIRDRAWIIRTAANLCKDHLKSRWRRTTVTLEAAAAVPAPEEEEASLLSAVNLLPPKYRAVIYLYYYEGYSAGEIAQLLGEKPATVSTQLSRGRQDFIPVTSLTLGPCLLAVGFRYFGCDLSLIHILQQPGKLHFGVLGLVYRGTGVFDGLHQRLVSLAVLLPVGLLLQKAEAHRPAQLRRHQPREHRGVHRL